MPTRRSTLGKQICLRTYFNMYTHARARTHTHTHRTSQLGGYHSSFTLLCPGLVCLPGDQIPWHMFQQFLQKHTHTYTHTHTHTPNIAVGGLSFILHTPMPRACVFARRPNTLTYFSTVSSRTLSSVPFPIHSKILHYICLNLYIDRFVKQALNI